LPTAISVNTGKVGIPRCSRSASKVSASWNARQLRIGANLNGLLVALVVCFTAITAVSLGILAAYTAVNGILYAFAPNRNQNASVLVPSETHASGD
jgi:hypothetical protein